MVQFLKNYKLSKITQDEIDWEGKPVRNLAKSGIPPVFSRTYQLRLVFRFLNGRKK